MDLDRFFSRLNPLMVGILRSPAHGLLSSGLLVLEITGRRTGKRYAIPVGYQRDGEAVTVLVSKARRKAWWRNFLEPGPLVVQLRGRRLQAEGHALAPGSEPFREAAATTLRRMPWLAKQFGVEGADPRRLGEADFARLDEEIAVVRIELGAPA